MNATLSRVLSFIIRALAWEYGRVRIPNGVLPARRNFYTGEVQVQFDEWTPCDSTLAQAFENA